MTVNVQLSRNNSSVAFIVTWDGGTVELDATEELVIRTSRLVGGVVRNFKDKARVVSEGQEKTRSSCVKCRSSMKR